MAAPVIKTCTLTTWVKVAENITACRIRKRNQKSTYYFTYVLASGTAPTDLSDAVKILHPGVDYFDFSAGAASDVYLYAAGEAGQVRIDT